MNARRSAGRGTHRFGGDWTTAKLDVIARYLASYTTALKDKPSKEHPFVKGYVDAFAGTGYRDAQRDDRSEDASQSLFLPDLAEAEPQALLDGSARLALKTEPRFDRYVFIEQSGAVRSARTAKARISRSRKEYSGPSWRCQQRDPGDLRQGLELPSCGAVSRSLRNAGRLGHGRGNRTDQGD